MTMLQALKAEADMHERSGAFAQAIATYVSLMQSLDCASHAEAMQVYCRLASCLMQTGQCKMVRLLVHMAIELHVAQSIGFHHFMLHHRGLKCV